MTLEERTERNKGLKRGGNLIGLMDGEVVIGSDQECRVMQDIKDVMVERNIIGDVVVMRECGTVTKFRGLVFIIMEVTNETGMQRSGDHVSKQGKNIRDDAPVRGCASRTETVYY